jgi:hypothetical protein
MRWRRCFARGERVNLHPLSALRSSVWLQCSGALTYPSDGRDLENFAISGGERLGVPRYIGSVLVAKRQEQELGQRTLDWRRINLDSEAPLMQGFIGFARGIWLGWVLRAEAGQK